MKTETTPAAETAPASGNKTVNDLTAMLRAKRAPSSSPQTPTETQSPAATSPETLSSEHTAQELEADPNSEITGPAGETPAVTPTPETPTEEPEAAVELDDEETVEAEDANNRGQGVQKLQKRLSKVVKQRNDERLLREHAEQRARDLERQLQTAKPSESTPPAPSNQEPFGWDPSIRELNSKMESAVNALEWAEENPDGGEFEIENGKTRTFTAAEVRQIKSNAVRLQSELAASKAAKQIELQHKLEAETQRNSEIARAAYPWLTSKETPEFQEAASILRRFPTLVQVPDFELLLGDLVVGRRLRVAKPKSTGAPATLSKPKVSPKDPTPQVAAPTATAPSMNARQKAVADARKELVETGSRRALTKLFAQNRAARADAA